MTNREIGKAALISDSTVKFHVRGIMRKLTSTTAPRSSTPPRNSACCRGT